MLNKYDLKYKEFISLRKKLYDLDDRLKEVPLVELEIPYQRGWEVYFDLKEDIKRRDDVDIIYEVLNLSYRGFITRNVKLVKAIRKGEKSYKAHKRDSGTSVYNHFYHRRLYNFAFTKEHKRYAKYCNEDCYKYYDGKRYYYSLPEYWLVFKTRPNIITHTRITGGPLQKERDYIKDRVWGSSEFQEFRTNYGRSYPTSKDRTRIRGDIRKFMMGEIEDIFNEKIPRIYEY